jgi:23S rRNA (adenine2503-C2)-methyltransferase
MSKVNLMGRSVDELADVMTSLGAPPFKGRQLFKWLYKFQQYDFQLMTDLTKELRSRLDDGFSFEGLRLDDAVKAADGTEKFLFRLDDGHPVESVLIPDEEKTTVCLSSQSGCALACRFCATGTLGLLRDLTVAEIVGQLVFVRERLGHGGVGNIVLMGMGEPLNNFDNVLAAIRIIINENGMDISPKRITVSTSGIVPKIRKLADAGLKVRLAVSLNAAIQAKRLEIMPVAQAYTLDVLMDAVKYYAEKTKSRVTFEYVLFKGFNDTAEDVQALARLLRGVPCKVNVLAYNPVTGLGFERPSDDEVDEFGHRLYPLVPALTVRRSRGLDIDAACGQLAAKKKPKGVYHV